MPSSPVGLNVSRLAHSCSFYLAALQPLDYRFQGKRGPQVGFGVQESDFFVRQLSTGQSLDLVHVLFDAPSQGIVVACFRAALKVGAQPYKLPESRGRPEATYSASVIDFDGHHIEFVCSGGPSDDMSAVSSARGSRLTGPGARSATSQPHAPQLSPLHSVVTNIVTTTTTAMKAATSPAHESATGSSKALTGTLIGAAAGATIAYVMMKAEQEPSAPLQPEETHCATVTHRYLEAPRAPRSAATARRRASFDSMDATSSAGRTSATYVRAIEGPASAYTADSLLSRGSDVFPRALPAPRSARPVTVSSAWTCDSDLAPAPSHASRTTVKASRTRSPQRGAARPASVARSASYTINAAEVSLPPSTMPSVRRSATDGPTPHAARSAAGHSVVSTSTVRPLTRANVERASAAGASAPGHSPPAGGAPPVALDDMATVAPNDSISQASSKRRHKKHHRRRASDDGAGSAALESAVTLPVREVRKEREPRSVATVLGLRGRS